MNRLLLVLFIGGLLLTACKKLPSISQQDTNNTALAVLDWKPLAFDYLVLKSKISFTTKGNTTNATANIRIKKDSIIWVSITPGMGIEAVRSIITPDSVKIINRLDNKYEKYSITYLKETLGIDLDFYNLQNLLVGDILLPISKEDFIKELLTEELWEVSQERKALLSTSLISKTLKKVTQLDATNRDQKQLRVQYGDFTVVDSLSIYKDLALELVNVKDTTFVDVTHQKIEFPRKHVSFPFSVPKKYEKQ